MKVSKKKFNSILDKKLFNILWFRSLFFSSNILGFFFFSKTKMSDMDALKLSLIKLGFDFKIFNNNNISSSFFDLNSYLFSFKGSFFVVYFKDFIELSKVNLDGCTLFSCFYNGYFLNNCFFNRLTEYYKFFNRNYLFLITLLLYFAKLYISLILQLKYIVMAQINLCIDYSKKNY